MLQSTTERIFAPLPEKDKHAESRQEDSDTATKPLLYGLYADIYRGLYIVRGENVLLLGEIDLDKDDEDPPGWKKGDTEEVKQMMAERKVSDQSKDQKRLKGLASIGFEAENAGEIIF